MGRYGRRISRSLIGALIVTLVLGLIFYLKDLKSTQAQPTSVAQKSIQKPQIAIAPPKPAPATQPLTTVTPTTPTTRPVNQPGVIPQAGGATAQIAAPSGPALSPADANGAIKLAESKKAAGDLLGARRLLNEALVSGGLSPEAATAVKKTMADINQTVVFSSQRFASDEFGGTYSVQSGDVLKKIAEKHEVPWELLLRLNGMSDPRKLRAGQTLKVVHGPFNAVVSKSHFTIDVWLGPPEAKGGLFITTFPVGLGKDDSTPLGTWQCEAGKKIKNPTYFSPRGEGVIDADDPKNPLGERWIGLVGIDGHAVGKSSYGIHGTIDETSIGKMESMGCIRMKNADVEWLFDLLVDGKSIVVVRD